MSANGNAAVSPKECPVCHDPFDIDANLPKVFGNCGHTVCAVCVPGCIRRQGQATCPLCRQETPIPPNGLPTIYVLKDILEAEQAASNAANVSCFDCGDFVIPSSAGFVCKTCTHEEIVVVCGFCGMQGHRAHDVVQYAELASGADIASLVSDEEQHNDTVQRQTTELASTIADEIKRIAK
ncbi:protein translocase subunit SECA2chloroplastic-like protein, partial [Aphelenchoides avenae]